MKKFIILLIFLIPLFTHGQTLIRWEQIKPISAQLEKLSPTANDLILIQDMGDASKIKYIKIASLGTGGTQQVDTFDIVNNNLRISLTGDAQPALQVSLSPYIDSGEVYETSVSVDGTTEFVLPFSATTTSQVFLNYNLIPKSLWAGEGSTVVTVNIPLKEHDYLIFNKN